MSAARVAEVGGDRRGTAVEAAPELQERRQSRDKESVKSLMRRLQWKESIDEFLCFLGGRVDLLDE